ncbi:MAG: GNAT family N-acetyltransferase, partial [bacterium]
TWPPEFYDPPAIEFTIARLEKGPGQAGWWLWYFVRRAESGADPILIGAGGYTGPPSHDGSVEIGYSILPDHQRQGYATEAVRGLLARAFTFPEVRSVKAETWPARLGSIAVLRKCGFRPAGLGSEPGTIRFELIRT